MAIIKTHKSTPNGSNFAAKVQKIFDIAKNN